jgi:peptidoglycan/LPS O-acetylase OafA/YrhL
MKIDYRPEIDGLRAIAVISVIIYHLEIVIFDRQFLTGGFLGVDIFFVISGYLITSIILKELFIAKSFDFINFYQRRIRRIIPVLLVVMLTSFPFAYFFLLNEPLLEFSKSIIYSLTFSSNFFFEYIGQQYNAESGRFKPFLHTWSLSIEEQYYILFPLFLVLIFKYLNKYLLHFLIIFFMISLIFSHWGAKNYPVFTFYLLMTRMWELLAGSILAYFEIRFNQRSNNKIFNFFLPSIGLLLIIGSFIYFDDKMTHPSFYTLLPVIGVCLIIWFSQKKEIIKKILSTKLLVGIGLISYSLYLWHYPIIVFEKVTRFSQNNFQIKGFLIILMIIFSLITYFYVEKPSRDRVNKFKKIFLIIIFNILLIITFSFVVVYKDGKVGHFYENSNNVFVKNKLDNQILKKETWKFLENFNEREFKSINKKKILIVGDSHSKDLYIAFLRNKDLFKEFEFMWFRKNDEINSSLNFDKSLSQKDLETLENSKVFKQSDVILISDYFSDEGSFKKLDMFISFFKNKKKIVLTSNSNIYFLASGIAGLENLTLFDNYILKQDKLRKIDTNNKKFKAFNDMNLLPSDIYVINKLYFENIDTQGLISINKRLEKISKKNKIKLIYKQDFQCKIKSQICYGVSEDGFKLFYDYGHFTLDGARFFGGKIYDTNWLQLD